MKKLLVIAILCVLVGSIAAVAEETAQTNTPRKWGRQRIIEEDHAKKMVIVQGTTKRGAIVSSTKTVTKNGDGSVTKSKVHTVTTPSGKAIMVNKEATKTKNADGTVSVSGSKSVTGPKGNTRTKAVEATKSKNVDGTVNVSGTKTKTNASGKTQVVKFSKSK